MCRFLDPGNVELRARQGRLVTRMAESARFGKRSPLCFAVSCSDAFPKLGCGDSADDGLASLLYGPKPPNAALTSFRVLCCRCNSGYELDDVQLGCV